MAGIEVYFTGKQNISHRINAIDDSFRLFDCV